MKRVLFIDRDGTIIREPEDFQVDSLEKVRFLPGAITNLARIARETDFALVMVSNQDGLGTESFPTESFDTPQRFVLDTLAMAYAETGNFRSANATAQKAIQVAAAVGAQKELTELQQRLQVFQSDKPYREDFSKTLVPRK